jgi:hypothetical protein
MNSVTWLYPAPKCVLPITHPARAHDKDEPDVRRTWEQHVVGDDYDAVERSAHLDFIGGFK